MWSPRKLSLHFSLTLGVLCGIQKEPLALLATTWGTLEWKRCPFHSAFPNIFSFLLKHSPSPTQRFPLIVCRMCVGVPRRRRSSIAQLTDILREWSGTSCKKNVKNTLNRRETLADLARSFPWNRTSSIDIQGVQASSSGGYKRRESSAEVGGGGRSSRSRWVLNNWSNTNGSWMTFSRARINRDDETYATQMSRKI